jgi:phospholipase C
VPDNSGPPHGPRALLRPLYDADFKPAYNNPVLGQPTYKSHFYDPDTGKNWLGDTDPTAVTQGTRYFNAAVQAYQAGDLATAGYNLGLALHYFTDLTQPMHAANFTWLSSRPRFGYHTGFEEYVMEVQDQVVAPTSYSAADLGKAPDPYLKAAAANSKSKYYAALCPTSVSVNYWGFTTYYRKLALQYVGPILTDAINQASGFLVAWGEAAGLGEEVTSAPAAGVRAGA